MALTSEKRFLEFGNNATDTVPDHETDSSVPGQKPPQPDQASRSKILFNALPSRLLREFAPQAAPFMAPDSKLEEACKEARTGLCEATQSLLKAAKLTHQLVFGEEAEPGSSLVAPEVCSAVATAEAAAGAAATAVDLALATGSSARTKQRRRAATTTAMAALHLGSEVLSGMLRPDAWDWDDTSPQARWEIGMANGSIAHAAVQVHAAVAYYDQRNTEASTLVAEARAMLVALDAVRSASTVLSFVQRAMACSLADTTTKEKKPLPVAFERARASAQMAVHEAVLVAKDAAPKLILLSAATAMQAAAWN